MDLFEYRRKPLTDAEVSKLYSEHLRSLIDSGLPFSEYDLRAAWAYAERVSKD